VCPNCLLIILKPQKAQLVSSVRPLTPYLKKLPTLQMPLYKSDQHWLISDQFSFENIGVSRDENGVRYLCCADCEFGPLGEIDQVILLKCDQVGYAEE
jgi:hypothetical protein